MPITRRQCRLTFPRTRSQGLTVPSPYVDYQSYEKHHVNLNIFSLKKPLFKTILLIDQKSAMRDVFNLEISILIGSRIGFFRQMSSYPILSHSPIRFVSLHPEDLAILVNDLELIPKMSFFYSIIRTKVPIFEIVDRL
jgi:hypothetical protein